MQTHITEVCGAESRSVKYTGNKGEGKKTGSKEEHWTGLLVQRTTQEIQLKENTQATHEILYINNLTIVLDPG